MWASQQDRPELVKLLLEKGADVNSRDRLGNTAVDTLLNIFKSRRF